MLGGLLGSDGQVADEDVGLGVAERLGDVDRWRVGLVDRLAVVPAEAVQRRTALHRDPQVWHLGEADRVVRLGQDGFGDVLADLLRVDVERGDDLDVADVVPAEIDVHQAGNGVVRVGVLVVLEPLHERGRAVPHADDRQSDLAHVVRSFLRMARCSRRFGVPVAMVSVARRSAAISPFNQAMSCSVVSRPCCINESV